MSDNPTPGEIDANISDKPVDETEDQFVAYYSPWVSGFGVVLCLMFVGLGVWLLIIFHSDPYADFGTIGGGAVPLLALALIVAFSALTIHQINAVQDKRPQLIIDHTGIFWRPWMKDTLPWAAIKKINVVEINMVTHIYLTPIDPNQAASTESALAVVWSVDWVMGNKRIPIKPFGLDKSTKEILAAIEDYRPSM